MTKQELIKQIEKYFGSGIKFFKYLGHKNPHQSWYFFKKTKKNNLVTVKFIELYGEFQRLKELLK